VRRFQEGTIQEALTELGSSLPGFVAKRIHGSRGGPDGVMTMFVLFHSPRDAQGGLMTLRGCEIPTRMGTAARLDVEVARRSLVTNSH